MNIDELFFYGLGVVWFIFFFRIVWINSKIIRRIKKLYPEFWEENMLHVYASPQLLIPELLKEVEDPVMRHYREQWDKALKQFVIAAFITIIAFIGYIAVFVGF